MIAGHVASQTQSIAALDLLGTPSCIGISHVVRRFDGRGKFKRAVGDTDNSDNCPRDDAQHMAFKDDATDEYVDCFALDWASASRTGTLTDATPQEGEEEAGVSGEVRRNLGK